MSAFSDWEQYAVVQRRRQTGCIPAGYEMLLRAANVKNVNFDTFQDDFDLDKNHKHGEEYKNNFISVANEVRQKYPDVDFQRKEFNKGDDKLNFIEKRIALKQPTLISLAIQGLMRDPITSLPVRQNGTFILSNLPAQKPDGYWHIMPVVDETTHTLVLLWKLLSKNNPDIVILNKKDLVTIHNNYVGGNDVAYLGS